jgi:hypothetical protein
MSSSEGGNAYALQADGLVKAWGNDHDRLLGRGTRLYTLRPRFVQEPHRLSAAARGWRLLFWAKDSGAPAFKLLDAPVNVRSLARGFSGGFAQRDGSYVDPVNAPSVDRGSVYR